MAPASTPSIVRFGEFEVDLAVGHVRRGRVRIHLREQSFQVLAALLERPGDLVTRDELRHRLWGGAVFVDFENGLNTAVGRLREAIGDSAERPRFIETLPRRGYRFIGRLDSAASPPPAAPRSRMIVLPLVNHSGDAGQEYFSDAMTDELITALANVAPGHLAVIARTTAMRYKHGRKDIARIAREVQADYVVEGSVQRPGPRVIVNLQLIRASDQTHVFSRRYDEDFETVFDLHARMAQELSARIPPVAAHVSDRTHASRPTADLAAYQDYIKARYEMWRWTPDSVARAKQLFESALVRDPGFALACDGLANLYGYLGLWGFLPPDDAEPLRWFYGARAAELDPSLAEPRTHVAYHPRKTRYEDAYSYDWIEAERGMAAARDQDPNSPIIRVRHASVLLVLGDTAHAVAELRRALEFDPLSPEVALWLAWVLFLSRDYTAALTEAGRFIDLEPRLSFSHMMLGLARLGAGQHDGSIEAFRRAAELSNEFPLILGWLGLALGLAGQSEEAEALLGRLRALRASRVVLPTSLAWIHLGLGQIDEAFARMDEAAAHNDEWIHPIKTYPFLDPVRADPRFGALMARLNLA
jgi:TolB-like protein/Flp pilus assembly protein TadD